MHTPETCDDCSLTWDRKHNPKDIVLCPLHAAAPKLLEALEAAFDSWFDKPRNIEKIEPRWVELSREAIKLAKGD